MDEMTRDRPRVDGRVLGAAVAGGAERAARVGRRRTAWGLAAQLSALLGAMFLGNVDVAIANVAGPSIKAGLHASGGQLELIVSGYTLAYAVLLVTCARLGQAREYRRMFLTGLAGFIVASLACALAPSATILVVARIAAGATAALMTAQVLTGIQLGFGGRARARALGLYSLVLSAGAVAGQSLGGLLISADVAGTAWRPAFGVNIPIGLALLWLAWRYLPADGRQASSRVRLDLAGVALLSAALVLLVLPLVLGQGESWPAWTWACLAASVPAFVLLWFVERKQGQPLVDPGLLARRAVGWGLASQAAGTATYFAVLFTLALYLQQGLGRSAAYSGLALVSWVAAFGIPGPVLGRLCGRARALAAPAGSLIIANSLHSPEMWQANHANINAELARQDPAAWDRITTPRCWPPSRGRGTSSCIRCSWARTWISSSAGRWPRFRTSGRGSRTSPSRSWCWPGGTTGRCTPGCSGSSPNSTRGSGWSSSSAAGPSRMSRNPRRSSR